MHNPSKASKAPEAGRAARRLHLGATTHSKKPYQARANLAKGTAMRLGSPGIVIEVVLKAPGPARRRAPGLSAPQTVQSHRTTGLGCAGSAHRGLYSHIAQRLAQPHHTTARTATSHCSLHELIAPQAAKLIAPHAAQPHRTLLACLASRSAEHSGSFACNRSGKWRAQH